MFLKLLKFHVYIIFRMELGSEYGLLVEHGGEGGILWEARQ
jgi:hypothetical protein